MKTRFEIYKKIENEANRKYDETVLLAYVKKEEKIMAAWKAYNEGATEILKALQCARRERQKAHENS